MFGRVALIRQTFNLEFERLKFRAVGKDLVFYLFAFRLRFILKESSLTVDSLALLLSLLLDAELLQLLLWIIFLVLLSALGVIVVSLHLVDFFLSLLADLDLCDRLAHTGCDTQAEFTDFFKFTNTVLHQKCLAFLHFCMSMAGSDAHTVPKSLASCFHYGSGLHFKLLVDIAHLSEQFFDLSERVDLINVFYLIFQESFRCLLNFVLLFGSISIILDTALVGKCVMHGKLLFQLTDFPLKLLQEKFRIHLYVHYGLVRDLNHSACELKSGNGLL